MLFMIKRVIKYTSKLYSSVVFSVKWWSFYDTYKYIAANYIRENKCMYHTVQ